MTNTTTVRTIQVSGFTTKNTATLWDGTEIATATSFDSNDFDFGDDTEKELEACNVFIKRKEETKGWIPGSVVCYIDTMEFTNEDIE